MYHHCDWILRIDWQAGGDDEQNIHTPNETDKPGIHGPYFLAQFIPSNTFEGDGHAVEPVDDGASGGQLTLPSVHMNPFDMILRIGY